MNSIPALLNLPAPGKLNLFLHVVGRRSDGYHLLQSAFMLVDWQDRIDLTLVADGRITRSHSGIDHLPADDLCVRAAHALQTATGCPYGVHIHLHKQLPIQAGMGGGSSDAATVLLGLNRLWDARLSDQQLRTIGLQLGADVPFFLAGRNAWVEGIGERLQPIDLPAARFVIVKPPAGLDTASIFSAPDLPRTTAPVAMHDFAACQNPFQFGHNDLQIPAVRLCPVIEDVVAWLAEHGLHARMTGAGSAVFAPLPYSMQPDTLQRNVPNGWNLRICGNLPHNPLLQCLT